MTMRALVVVESGFGNTRAIGEAVADGLGGCPVLDVGEATPGAVDGRELLVVGGPTHAFGMSRPRTREDAADRGAAGAGSVGIREWLARLEPRPDLLVAPFDTKVERVRRLPGSAAHAAARLLRRRGFDLVADPVSFYVDDVAGPLLPGEVERARAWGAGLAEPPYARAGA